MARSRSPSKKFFEKYPGVYARTSDTWTTRYYNRKQDPIFNMGGLCTAPDDFHKKEGSSPYLTNVRFMGEREEDQRAQVMSRRGAAFMATIGEDIFDRQESEGDSYLEVYEGKAIEWELEHSRLLTGLSLYLHNESGAQGFLKITIRNIDTSIEISNAVIDLSKVNINNYTQHRVRIIKAVSDTRVLARVELIDDVTDEEDRTEDRERRAIRILSVVDGRHKYATYELPNVDDSLEEIPFVFTDAPVAPLTGVMVNDWEPMLRSEEFRYNGQKYMAFPVRHDGIVEIMRINLMTKELSLLTSSVDSRATAVRFAQAEGYLYYVDGYSPYRRVNLTTLTTEDVVPLVGDITLPGVLPVTLTAKPGAPLIHRLNNRMYLSGFADDPNLVIMSLIDDVKPRFEQFNDRFYSPDQSPQLSSGSPITALADISNYLVVWRVDGLSMYDRGSSTILEDSSQITPEGAQLGVLNQEAVAQGSNNIYFFNPTEGVCRFAGSVNRNVSIDIVNLLKRIKHKEAVFMLYQNKAVRMYFSFDEEKPDSCFYYYTEQEGKLPWYMDVNTPVSSAIAATDSESIYAVHSQAATVMDVDSQLTDFDSYIVLEYHTQYRVPPTTDPSGFSIVRRLHLHELVAKTHSIYLGLDIDHQDKPIVWRRFVEAQIDDAVNPDAVFQHTAEPGIEVISIPMYVQCRKFQIRFKRYCYKDQGEVIGSQIEYGNVDAI